MKIYIYTNTPYPNGLAGTNRVHQIAKGLLRNDVNVELIITNPTEDIRNIKNVSSKGLYESVAYKYIYRTTVRSKNLFIRKLIDFYCYLKVYLHFILFASKADAVIVIGGGTFDFRNLLPYLSKITKTKIILEINEYPFVTMKNSFMKRFKFWFFCRLTVPLYDGFIVISDALKTKISEYANSKSTITKIPILSEQNYYKYDNEKSPFDEPYIIHAGSLIDEKDGILDCLRAFAKAKKQIGNILYVFAGNFEGSPQKKQILQILQKECLTESVLFVGNKMKDELQYLYRHAFMAIVNKPNNDQNIYGFNTKISEYVANRIPMILSNVGENSIYFKDQVNALIVNPNNIDEISEKIVFMYRNPENVKKMVENAYELVQKEFNPESSMKSFLKELRSDIL